MNEAIKSFFKTILFLIALVYFALVISLSIFILNENDYGVTVYKDYSYVIITDDNVGKNTDVGMLVVVKNIGFDNYIEDDELYVYESDTQNKVVVKYGFISNINKDGLRYVVLKDKKASYKEELILGVPVKKIYKIGGIIEFLKDKWIFLMLIIVPSSFIAIYEIVYIFKHFVFNKK